jgi:hypothetical protein
MSWRANKELADQIGISDTRVFAASQLIPPGEMHLNLFTLNGAGVDPDMAIDGSAATGTPSEFRYIVPADKTFLMHSIGFHLLDASFDFNGFGAGAALTNGLRISIHDSDDTVLVRLVEGFPIDKMVEFAHFGTPATNIDPAAGAADDMFSTQIVFQTIIGYTPFLTAGQYIEIHVEDDLSGLTHFEATIGGRLIDA